MDEKEVARSRTTLRGSMGWISAAYDQLGKGNIEAAESALGTAQEQLAEVRGACVLARARDARQEVQG